MLTHVMRIMKGILYLFRDTANIDLEIITEDGQNKEYYFQKLLMLGRFEYFITL